MSHAQDLDDKRDLQHIEENFPEGHVSEKELEARRAANVDEGKVKLTAATLAYLAVFFGAFGVFVQLVAMTGPGNIISYLSSDLGRPDLSVWIIQCPTIVQAALAPFVGRLSDEIGRKWLICGAPVFGVIGAIIASQANSMQMLIGASVIMGLAQTTVGLLVSLPSEVLPSRLRSYSGGAIQLAGSSAAVLAALGTGGFVNDDPAGWRNFYYMVIGLWVLAAVGPYFFYNPPPRAGSTKSWREVLHYCDIVGTCGTAATVVLIILGINFGSSTYGFNSPYFAAPLAIGFAIGILTGIYETKFRTDGIFHHDLFKYSSRNFAVSSFIMFVEGWLYFSAVAAFYPMQVRFLGWETEAFQVGLRKFYFNATQIVLVAPIVYITTKTKNVKWILCFALCAYLSAMAAFSQLTEANKYSSIAVVVVAGIGMTPQLILVTLIIQLSAPPHLIATASAIGLTIRGIGGGFGSAVMGSQLNKRMNDNLAPALRPVALAGGIPESGIANLVAAYRSAASARILALPGLTPELNQSLTTVTRATYAAAFEWAYITVIPATALGVIVVLLLDSKKIKARMNNSIDATMEKQKMVMTAPDTATNPDFVNEKDEKISR